MTTEVAQKLETWLEANFITDGANIISVNMCTQQKRISHVPPSTLQEEKGSGEYFYLRRNFCGTIWLADMAIISPVLASLPQTT